MKIVHLADTHLGYTQFAGRMDPVRRLNQRECDVFDRWHEAINIAIDRQPGLVVHAGDLFDSARPSPRALAEALDGFARLRDADIPSIVIAGNHETPRFRSGGSVFEILERFGVHAVWSGPRTIVVGGVAVHAVPHQPSANDLAEDIRSLPLDSAADANVLVLHTGLEGIPRQGYGEVNEIDLDPELLVELDYDYIALGHLHKFQAPQANAMYPGSLERLDFADLRESKAVLEVDLEVGPGKEGFVARHPVSARSVLDFPIQCEGLGPSDVLAGVTAALDGEPITDAVVRVRLEMVARDVYHALDFESLDALLETSLHHVFQVGRSGLAGTEVAGTEVSFDAFARAEMPKDVDSGAVLAIAKRHLGDAAQAEAEAAANEVDLPRATQLAELRRLPDRFPGRTHRNRGTEWGREDDHCRGNRVGSIWEEKA